MKKSFVTQERERKRAEAEARQKIYDSLTIEQKFEMLDRRVGDSRRERVRLLTKQK